MSASSRTVQATPGMGQLVAIFAALLAGTALIVALAYGQLTASQSVSLAPAAAPAPAYSHDESGRDTTPIRPATRGRAFDKSHHAVRRSVRFEENSGGSTRVQLAQ
jgi:hypothetical protein